MQGHSPPTASTHEWGVAWVRTFRGIPYRGKGADVYLNAETGKIISVSFGIPCANPPTASEDITQEQAQSIAEAQLNAVGLVLSDLPIVTVRKEVIETNYFWQTGRSLPYSLNARVVWDFHYGVSLDTIEIWVDAETGDVVGGDREGTLGGGVKIKMPKFGHQLKHTVLAGKSK